MSDEQLSLTNVMNGGLVELFDRELGEVLRNIADVNCPADKSRKINFEVTFKPFDDRSGAEILVKCASKLVGAGAPKTQIFLAKDKSGKVRAWSNDPRQVQLFQTDSEAGVQ